MLPQPVPSNHHGDGHASVLNNDAGQSSGLVRRIAIHSPEQGGVEGHHSGGHEEQVSSVSYSGDWYTLYASRSLRLSIGWYIDSLTVLMFVVVTFIATCIHVYAAGYMHDELHDVTDSEVQLATGEQLHREGRFHRFFQALSLFCFSMLGIVIAGNLAMVFIFWELVGICSWFLIGFYFERHSASTAANKAFIVNRVGDFGMLIGLMALWGGLGTLHFGDSVSSTTGQVEPGLFELVRPVGNHHEQQVPDGLVAFAAADQIKKKAAANPSRSALRREVAAAVPGWREQGYGRWLLFVAGLGIFCGCVGKSAQVPLFVWLPDAMEGPTPV
ncbi:MAG TPA: NADH-quinone oxidoreductase subunit L, partial [Planctomycetaceae bacterium]|nr:NADH-quinone oxidoreductase subunit L [Planctomycetaceae bacterium]